MGGLCSCPSADVIKRMSVSVGWLANVGERSVRQSQRFISPANASSLAGSRGLEKTLAKRWKGGRAGQK